MTDQPNITTASQTDPVADMMAAVLAHLLNDGETVFHDLASPLSLVAILLAQRLHAPNLVHLCTAGGVEAVLDAALPLSSADPSLVQDALALFPVSDIFDLSARGRLDVALVTGKQIDAQGRINASVIGDFDVPRLRLPGGAGSAFLLPTARRSILWTPQHTPDVFVESLDFVTAAGRVDRVVTPLCVFVRRQGRLHVESIHPDVTVAQVVAATGFELADTKNAAITPPPTPAELAALSEIDPDRIRNYDL